MSVLKNVKPSDVKKLLDNAVGFADGHILLNDNCKSSESDELGLTRMYGLGTSISSATRMQMGLTEYDVTACFQSIMLAKCLPSTKTVEHERFVSNPKAYREDIARIEGISYKKAKEAITKITFGGSNWIEALDSYAAEEAVIRRSVLSMAQLADDGRYDDAVDIAQRKESADIASGLPAAAHDEMQSKILFHLLAMDEKLIRDAMSGCFDAYPMQVHDAVYSYQDLPVSVLEGAVLSAAGIKLNINKSKGAV